MDNTQEEPRAATAIGWLSAWAAAATGPDGFWRTHRVGGQFRTASGSQLLAEAIGALIGCRPEIEAVVEVGAGDAALLTRLRSAMPALRFAAVELRPGPNGQSGVDWRIGHWDVKQCRWRGPAAGLFEDLDRPTMIICAEWLDELPCPVASWDGTMWRELLVRPDGSESVGGRLQPADDDWLHRWWPSPAVGTRAECGLSRDLAWSAMITSLRATGGLALMIDYGHTRDDRPYAGSLTGYADGRQVVARPDPMINLTAHVAIDAVAAAGERSGAITEFMIDQRTALGRFLPEPDVDPRPGPLGRLQRASELRMLTDTLGHHRWLLQSINLPSPTSTCQREEAL